MGGHVSCLHFEEPSGNTYLTGSYRKDGWDPSKVQASKGFINDMVMKGDVTANTLPLNNVAENLKQPKVNQGFRFLMDADENSIVVSGSDGGIYAVDLGRKV